MNRWRQILAVEVVLAVVSAAMLILTFVWDAWIETVFGFDPDHGSGSLEWAITAGLLALTVVLTLMARVTWQRHLRGAT